MKRVEVEYEEDEEEKEEGERGARAVNDGGENEGEGTAKERVNEIEDGVGARPG